MVNGHPKDNIFVICSVLNVLFILTRLILLTVLTVLIVLINSYITKSDECIDEYINTLIIKYWNFKVEKLFIILTTSWHTSFMETSIALSIYMLQRGVTSQKMHNCNGQFWDLTHLCSMHIERAMAVSGKFYIWPRAGFYWREIGVTGLPWVCGQFSGQEWTVLRTKTGLLGVAWNVRGVKEKEEKKKSIWRPMWLC